MAWQELENERCPGCGQPRHEAWDSDAEYTHRVEAMRCHACKARARVTRSFGEDAGGTDGLFTIITKEA